MIELKPCPFCGWKAKPSYREMKFLGQNYIGWKKIKFAAYGMCNRCKAKGPTVTKVIICGTDKTREELKELKQLAIEKWNRRAET